ncbi:RNA-binding S4 domain-containing protein [Rhizobium grahamii]|uniref:RNA-binding S4 domain-containing protein n=1 Tax=Rhizobium grahamii TaxID=1120045 RepID=A0A5Q0C8K2_9HYPH|nr:MULTISPECIES: RNA-binding S4 domain-containing protein [Rhizobium]QFY61753.1 RNA-binding S4 domain-containing protein [Rhizobium grahamii]QRM49082.1 RNA-binding S4 domain-containing protein [Rhizobium sp. BG6]
MSGETQPATGSRQRIDKWLFFTRMVKSRSLAQSHVQSGHVRINGARVLQPSQMVKIGDKIELTLERRDVILQVKAGGERRGPYEEARLLYDDLSPSPEETAKLTPYEQAIRAAGAGRPTKKERRAIDRLMSDDD